MIAAFIKLSLCLLTTLTMNASVKDPIYDEFEGLNLVEALTRDKKLDLAERELSKIKTRNARFWMARGHLYLAEDKPKAAAEAYAQAPESPERQLWLARALAMTDDAKACARAYSQSAPLWTSTDADVIRKAACEFKAADARAAWDSLGEGSRRHSSFAITREHVALALEIGLTQQAKAFALERAPQLTTAQILSLAELFHQKQLPTEALSLVELARIAFPADLDAHLTAAQIYYQLNQPLATVDAFERAALIDAKYAYHVTELRRQMRHFQRAMYFSPMVPDEKDRLKARLALYIDQGRYPLITSLNPVVARSPLRGDDEVRYALAYSLFRFGAVDEPLEYLSSIQRPEILEKAARLKKSVLECRDNPTACRL